MDYKPYSPEWHRKRYLKEAIDNYLDDYVENDIIVNDILDILKSRMRNALENANKLEDLISKINEE
jgi:hypothetical protein|tara:strand:+ start:675 stop:872 length:198 start_codon:yes stop_codon:yes gene_type:complete